MPTLFDTLPMGTLRLPNRIVMAPMTRRRADEHGVLGPLTATYYAQRAGAGLIISEGTCPSAMGHGLYLAPGIYSDAQVAGWRGVTDAVHKQGGRIFLQIMHCGRASHPSLLPDNALPVGPSAIAPPGEVRTPSGMQPRVIPRALEADEIADVIADYRRATERAFEAGFDGVELHAASGYLPDQFLNSSSNIRTDRYGGSALNRSRFILEALEAMIAVRGAGSVGIKLSPNLGIQGVTDDNPRETFSTAVTAIAGLGLAYLFVSDSSPDADFHRLLRPLFPGPYLAGTGFTPERAAAFMQSGTADAVVFGKLFIANPDLADRIRRAAPLNEPDLATYYTPGAAGYTDYPTLDTAA
jgi:N-ethylmaleimide reductase